MRSLATVLAVCAPFIDIEAFAQGRPVPKVEVTNFPDPQNVNVVNAPLQVSFATPRAQLVGFTSGTFSASTGVLGFTAACQDQFPNSRM